MQHLEVSSAVRPTIRDIRRQRVNFMHGYKAKPLRIGCSIRTKYFSFLKNTRTQSHVPTRIIKYPKMLYRFSFTMINSHSADQSIQHHDYLHGKIRFCLARATVWNLIFFHVSLTQWMKYNNTMNFHSSMNICVKTWYFGHHIHGLGTCTVSATWSVNLVASVLMKFPDRSIDV